MMASLAATAVAAALIAALVGVCLSWRANRRHVRRLQAAGAPMPEFHPIFGHLVILKQSIQKLPRNATMHVVVRRMSEQFANGIFYLNLWPFNETVIVVTDPNMASQVEAAFLDKPSHINATLDIINGGPSLQTMHGDTWKQWRSLLNPGFASGYMIQLAPAIAEEVGGFCKLLEQRARLGKVFQLEGLTLRLTFDVIARVTLDARLHYQTQGSPLADCLRRQVYWTPFGTTFNPIRRYLSPRPLVRWYNSYRMNQYLGAEIDKRFEELAAARREPSKRAHPNSRSIIALAMDKYLDELGDSQMSKNEFKRLAISQLRLFLYAGHDTTSSTLLYCYLLLSQNPDSLSKVREEHDAVFGKDSSVEYMAQAIERQPTLLNQLPYTLAVTKEVLRLFPPAGSMRSGRPDLLLSDDGGQHYPTDGCSIWVLSLGMHHSPRAFVKPDDFFPDRWLVGSEDPLYPKKASWRPFEWGPRSCIGQSLAMLELRVALVMTVRHFDIIPAYDEWDKINPRGGIKEVDGNRAYQSEMGGGGAHPVDGFPVKVWLRTGHVPSP